MSSMDQLKEPMEPLTSCIHKFLDQQTEPLIPSISGSIEFIDQLNHQYQVWKKNYKAWSENVRDLG